MDLDVIRTNIVTQLKANISGLEASAKIPDGIPVLPYAFVGFPVALGSSIAEYDQTFEGSGGVPGMTSMHLVIKVLVSRWDAVLGQENLDPFISNDPTSTMSIYQAIRKDRTLEGSVQSARVVRARSYGKHTVGENHYVGVDFDVSLID